jgi:hypothetical protein
MRLDKRKFAGIALALNGPILAFAQGAGAGADHNRAEREKVTQTQEQQATKRECQRKCDSIAQTSSLACARFPGQGQPSCNTNVQKQRAACHKTCK